MAEEENNIKEPTVADIIEFLDEFLLNYNKETKLLQQKLEEQDKLTALILKTFFEMNTAIQYLIEKAVEPLDEESRTQYRKELNERHSSTMKTLQEVANQLADTSSSDPSASILKMVGRDTPDTGN